MDLGRCGRTLGCYTAGQHSVHANAAVTELAEPFALSLPAVSRHIRVLERARLIRRTVDGRVHQCALSAHPLRHVDAWLAQYCHFWETKLDSFARYVES